MDPIQEKPINPKGYGVAPDSVPPAHIKKPQRPALKQGANLSQTPAQLNGTITTPNLTYRVMSQMAFGPSDADLEHINNLSGANEMDRNFAYIDER